MVSLAALIVLAASAVTRAEVVATRDAIINFDSKIFPRVLPRSGSAPVAIKIEGHVKEKKGREPSALTKIELAIHKAANVFRSGRPICEIPDIDPASPAKARAACPGAQIGYGRIRAKSQFPGQKPFFFNGRVTAFNGRLEDGKPGILFHVFNAQPRTSFVFPFVMSRGSGRYGTVLTANTRINRWSRVTDFTLLLDGGDRKGYLSASCPAPEGLNLGISPFVRATLSFDDGEKSHITVVSSCKVAD